MRRASFSADRLRGQMQDTGDARMHARAHAHTRTLINISLAIRQCARAWSSFNIDHSKLSRKKKTSETKGNLVVIRVRFLLSLADCFLNQPTFWWRWSRNNKPFQGQRAATTAIIATQTTTSFVFDFFFFRFYVIVSGFRCVTALCIYSYVAESFFIAVESTTIAGGI